MSGAEQLTIALIRTMARDGRARAIRTEADLTLAEMGQMVGVGHSAILRWETGQRTPRGPLAVRYAEALLSLTQITDTREAAVQ